MLNVLTQNSYGLGRRLILLAALLVVLAAGTLVPAADRTLPLAGLALAALIALVGTRQDRTEARRLQTPTLNQQPTFCDDIFAQEGNWVTMHHADGNTLCETLLETHGDADQALALLRGPWSWWGRGHAREYSELPGHTTDQILVPVYWYWCHVRMRLLAPVRLAENVWRIPGVLAGSFDGPATFDVISHPGTNRLTIRGRFHNVQDNVPIFPQHFVTRSHLRAEAGVLPFPFPQGTGWLGLRNLLEARLPESEATALQLTLA